MDARSVLGLSAVRPALLDDVSPACSPEAEARDGTDDMRPSPSRERRDPPAVRVDDEFDDDIDDEFDDEFDEDEDEDGEDDGDDDEEPETWQVHGSDLQ